MKREVITTNDGSKTIRIVDWDEQYHSVHGAINEAKHVFIKHGLQFFAELNKFGRPIDILEIGFGTGLNVLVTYNFSKEKLLQIHYTGIEAYPVSLEEISNLNYPDLLDIIPALFRRIHEEPWETPFSLSETFTLEKQQLYFQDIEYFEKFYIIYFDAFGARVQPELWEKPMFEKMYRALRPGGLLVTYSAKGSVRRAMSACGFVVERLPGPPGKREMLRAIKKPK